MDKSPLAPDSFPELPDIRGVNLATAAAEIKYAGRDDLLLAVFSEQTTAAGVFTQSLTASAPVMVCRSNLKAPGARALLVNSGNANAFTGKTGNEHCARSQQLVAVAVGCDPKDVFLASTGVIGELLPIEKFEEAVPGLSESLGSVNWEKAANAILTTDTFPKGASVKTNIGGKDVIINGIAKGSGMIAPDMATMLAFCFTDAKLPAKLLQQMLEEANHKSFNAITVDSDTSTSDTCMLFATGVANNEACASADDSILQDFRTALNGLMLDLAIQVVRDGEGASKLIQVNVTGAQSDQSARVIANSIANSPLVKTAVAGEDANWGRVVMAVGKSGQRADRDNLQIKMGGVLITENGEVVKGYDEKLVARHLKQQKILIDVDVGVGFGEFTVWTCDLTHGYITINADYRS